MTHRAGEAETLARRAVRAGCDYVIAAGGDGTLNEVINGIATPNPPRGGICVGVVPLGTANDFARSIGLMGDIDATIDILQVKTSARIDLVRMTGERTRYFVNASAGGFSGVVDEKLTPEIKSAWGPLAYLRSAAAALPELHAYRTTVTLWQILAMDCSTPCSYLKGQQRKWRCWPRKCSWASISPPMPLPFDAQRRSQFGRTRECGSMPTANWSAMSQPFSKFFLAR